MSTTNSTTTATAPRSVEATELDPKKIHPHPLNKRQDATPDEGLVASVRAHGIHERLLLAPVPEDLPEAARKQLKRGTQFLLIAGHRRRNAAIAAKAKTVPVDIRHDLDTTEAQLGVIAAENIHRRDLSPLEEGDIYLELQGLGLNQGQIHDRTHVAKPRISERSRVAKLPGTARAKFAGGQLTMDAALFLARVEDESELERIMEQPPYMWLQEARRVLAERDAARAAKKDQAAFERAGVAVLYGFPLPEGAVELFDLIQYQCDAAKVVRAVLTAEGNTDDLEAFDAGDPPTTQAGFIAGVFEDEDRLTAWHAGSCSAHAVVRDEHKNTHQVDWWPVCLDPALHEDLQPEQPETPTEAGSAATGLSGEEARAVAAREQVSAGHQAEQEPDATERNALAAAAVTRRAWLRELLGDTNRAGGAVWAICKAGLDATATPRFARLNRDHPLALGLDTGNGEGCDLMLDLLSDLDPPADESYRAPAGVVAAWADHSIQASPAPRLALATFLAGHASREWYLGEHRVEWKDGDDRGYAVPWIRTLDAIGYPWTKQELEWLGRTQSPDDAADADDGVDQELDKMLADEVVEDGAA